MQGDNGTYGGAHDFLVGNDGDDIIYGGDNHDVGVMWIYGDSIAYDDSLERFNTGTNEFARIANEAYGMDGDYGELTWRRDFGDDVIKGGDNGTGAQYIVGGYGDDKIWSGTGNGSPVYLWGDNRAYDDDEDIFAGNLWEYGRDGDGDDIIDVGENIGQTIVVFGQGGNDKIIGSL